MKQRVLYKILLSGHRLVHYPWKIPVYFGALVFRNDKVSRCQYAYNLKIPNVSTALGIFKVLFEWNKLHFEIKLIPYEFDYRNKLYLIFDNESTFEFVIGA